MHNNVGTAARVVRPNNLQWEWKEHEFAYAKHVQQEQATGGEFPPQSANKNPA